MLAGVLAYRRHAYRRTLPAPPVVWRSGAARLYDYGTEATAKANGVPVLFVPSLINRSYVLDLSKRTSMLRYLADHGVWPFLIDWGRPGTRERDFTLTDYIVGVLEEAFKVTQSLAGERVAIAGYCMGGLLALALALRQRDCVPGLALLATPWDFHAGERGKREGQVARTAFESFAPLVDALGEMPVDVLQSFFFLLNPFQSARKFRTFASLDPNSERAQDFVALEDWINDGTALAGSVARECLLGWYGDNTPARGEWKIADRKVRPETFDVPSLVLVPSQDYIVPPASAHALAAALPRVETQVVATGHIGMAVGARAKRQVWQPLAEWLKSVYAV
ncbi:MAG: alpha/beta fold hydrolase [Alphaproteobacteria bacterium]|nr:alpha/beta fold hydrolase [Alphaproteobacteria bacterium]